MRKTSSPDEDPRELSEQDFRFAVRGKYRARYRDVAPVPSVNVHVWAPLRGFEWAGLKRQIAPDTWVRPAGSYDGYERSEFADFLSREDLEECREARHWLWIVQPAQYEISTRAALNLFLLALWIVKSTRCQVALRFEEAESSIRTVARLLDRFKWVGEHLADEILDKDLEDAGRMLAVLRDVHVRRGRLATALGLTFRGCVAGEAQAAFICYAAAAEAVLISSTEEARAEGLAANYARLVAHTQSDRISAATHFARLYSVRSDIIHGRTPEPDASESRLHDLAEFADALRHVWRAVLDSSEAQVALEADDNCRATFFAGR